MSHKLIDIFYSTFGLIILLAGRIYATVGSVGISILLTLCIVYVLVKRNKNKIRGCE